MQIRAAVCSGLDEPWKVEEVEVDAPGPHEVRVQMAYAGMCHSDEHLRTGDMSAPAEVLSVFGVDSMFPMIGGHEGSGTVSRSDPGWSRWRWATTWPCPSSRHAVGASGAPRAASTCATWG